LKSLFEQRDFPVIFTRASNVFGPGQQLYRIVPKTILAAIEGSRINLHGGGASTRSFIFMRDVVEAIMLIISKGEIGKSYHISTNSLTTIKELIHEEFGDGIMSAIDFSMDIQREPDPKGDRVQVVLSGKYLSYKTY
jgi:dTDP-D-glucose 4,6-dehydratase